MKFNFKLLIFTVFVAANLNAMQPFKRVLPVLLKNGVKFTPREYQYLSEFGQHNSCNVTKLAKLTSGLNYCPIRNFSYRNPEKIVSEMCKDIMNQYQIDQIEQKYKIALDKIVTLLEDDKVQEFLRSNEFREIFKIKIQEFFEDENFRDKVRDEIDKAVEVLLKDKTRMTKLLKNKTFLKLMNSPEVKQFLINNQTDDNTKAMIIGCVLGSFIMNAFLIYIGQNLY